MYPTRGRASRCPAPGCANVDFSPARSTSGQRRTPPPHRKSRTFHRTPENTMRYLTWIRHPENAGAPPQALNDAMIKFVERSYKSGALVDTGGLAGTKEGFRIRMSKGKLKTTDGPFTETKEIVGGYAIISANSREEAYK